MSDDLSRLRRHKRRGHANPRDGLRCSHGVSRSLIGLVKGWLRNTGQYSRKWMCQKASVVNGYKNVAGIYMRWQRWSNAGGLCG
jgi:hypothetical protein